MHTYTENEVMHPRVRELLPELEDDVRESYEEHPVAGEAVVAAEKKGPGTPAAPSALKKTIDAVIR